MSFSSEVKDELSQVFTKARHCELAELAALLSATAKVKEEPDGPVITVSTENEPVARKVQQLIEKSFGYTPENNFGNNNTEQANSGHNTTYRLKVTDKEEATKILQATRLMGTDGRVTEDLSLANMVGISNSCCKRAFLRGAFCAGGSISDPEKSYHLEIVAGSLRKAQQLVETMQVYALDARIVKRRRNYVVYLKEGEQIEDMLKVMDASKAYLKLVDVRILKDMRNSINRKVNCETANLGKTVAASVKQVEDIRYIDETIGLGSLKEGLAEIAKLRLENPDTSIKDLGTMLDPPVGKSGVNHRLRKISEIADDLRTHSYKGGRKEK